MLSCDKTDDDTSATSDEETPVRLRGAKPGYNDDDEEVDAPRPMWYRILAFLLSEHCKCLHTFILLAFFCILLYPLYKYCVPCLFLEIIVTACLCPYFNALNIPLWASIIVLIFGGYTLNWGDFQVIWLSRAPG